MRDAGSRVEPPQGDDEAVRVEAIIDLVRALVTRLA
jgi:hypothetical protein